MIDLISSNIENVKLICQKCKVQELHVFGSAINGSFNLDSDIDFVVLFDNNIDPIEKGSCYFNLLQHLEDLLQRKIELISYSAIKNPIFKEEVDNTKVTLYAA